jgi:RNA polymerase-binding transcription factor DksA
MTRREALKVLTTRRQALARLAAVHHSEEGELLAVREPDWEDTAAEVRDARVLGRLAEDERRELAVIDAALARIDDGSWGNCLACAKRIHARRLSALPEATLCIKCAESAAS